MSGIPRLLKRHRQPGQRAYTVGGVGFDTKAALHRHAQAIHRNLPPAGTVLKNLEGAFMLELFQYHHNWASKRGPGVEAIVVGLDGYGGKLMRLRRVDGSEVDISWVQCIHGQRSQIAVLRHEIADQISAFKTAALAGQMIIRCPIDDVLVGALEVDVDHAPPHSFSKIATTWCFNEGVAIDDMEVVENLNGIDLLANRDQATRWKTYHQQHATLRLISRQAHKRLTRTKT